MYSLNRATIIGNLTQDPEVRQLPSGQSVCNFTVATNRYWTSTDGQKQEATEFHSVVAWRKLAEICAQYLGKGRKVYIDGYLQTRSWDGQDSVKRSRTEIVAENMIILDKGPGGNRPSSGGAFAPPQPPMSDPGVGADDEIRVEDIPF
ncbi:single-stranded DNA-binding protein [Candidatus Uhrbacteria bacterium CG_4_9_14_3_um_filter_50_9]|uniref:Single-stranded DNA-binding protein n=1 Tax=Candidatus Uhrbacteria bacterium CG_4_9_14_3_um_filter_50_9 TaxID=1975035 RepID=A0A2M7XCH1_9BACT|nr:MAG: single-stranded DNA-binding protein [Candidatus Uhrbacteria bacterium CG_4_9_14_3_um_filter_50_9]